MKLKLRFASQFVVVVLFLLVMFAQTAQAIVLQPPVAGNVVNLQSSTPTSNINNANLVYVGERNNSATTNRSLIKYDLSGLPDNAIIESAVLKLRIGTDLSDNARTFRIYKVKRPWVVNQATWNVYSTGNPWQTAGGFGADDVDQVAIGSADMTDSETIFSFKDFVLTPTTKADLDLGNGWLIKADVEEDDSYLLNAIEPALTITYSLPVADGDIIFSNVTDTTITATTTNVSGELDPEPFLYRVTAVDEEYFSGPTSTPVTFTGLTPLTLYTFEVGIQDSLGNWSTTTTFSTTTLESDEPPPPPDTGAVIRIDQPSWYTTSGGPCNPESGTCYFPSLGLSITQGHAPFPVFFQASSSTLPDGSIVEYAWDFDAGTEDDFGGRYFKGLNAAHVFETPGTYEVMLTVTDHLGNLATTSETITVLANSGTTYYVDSDIGNDSCNGTSATVVDSSICPWKTADKALSQIARPSQWAPLSQWYYKPGDRVLFKRGQTFDFETPLTIGHGFGTQGYHFGAYGNSSDPKPIIQYKGPHNNLMLSFGFGTGYIGFVDLRFNFLDSNTDNQAQGLFGSGAATKNILFLRNDFYETYNSAVGASNALVDNPLTNFFVVDSTFQNPTTHIASVTHQAVFGVHGFVLWGNRFDKSGNHISYNSDVRNGLVSGNVFSRPAFGRTALRIISGRNIYVADNQFLGWIDSVNCFVEPGGCTGPISTHNGGGTRYNFHLVNFGPGSNNGPLTLTDIVFERNILTNFESGLDVVNAENFVVRNNLFITPSSEPNGARALTVSAPHGEIGLTRPLENVRVIGNTFILNGQNTSGGPLLLLHPWTSGSTDWGSNHSDVVIGNNLFYGINGSQSLAVRYSGTNNSLLDVVTQDNNLVFMPSAPSGKPFRIGSTSYDLAEWQSETGKDLNTITLNPQFHGTISEVVHATGEPGSLSENQGEALLYENALRLTAGSPQDSGGTFNDHDSYYDYDYIVRNSDPDIGAYEYAADVVAPTLLEITPVPNPTNDSTPNYTFFSSESGNITYGGSCSSNATSAQAGNNTITFNELGDGTYSDCTITVTDDADNESDPLSVSTFEIDTSVPPDTDGPSISNVTSSANTNSASINWNTNEPATSQVWYGTTPTVYSQSSNLDSGLVQSHLVFLTGLTPNTTYYYLVSSSDSSDNTSTSSERSFTTRRSSSGSGGGSSGGSYVVSPIITPPTPVQPVPPSGLAFSRDLTLNSEGADVRLLQQYLNSAGFLIASSGPGSPGQETNFFGELTRAALARFQAARGIVPALGYFGPITRLYMNIALALPNTTVPTLPSVPAQSTPTSNSLDRPLFVGLTGPDVLRLQEFLISHGYLAPGNSTGYFGELTKAAVGQLQIEQRLLTSTADSAYGYVGPATREFLNRSLGE